MPDGKSVVIKEQSFISMDRVEKSSVKIVMGMIRFLQKGNIN